MNGWNRLGATALVVMLAMSVRAGGDPSADPAVERIEQAIAAVEQAEKTLADAREALDQARKDRAAARAQALSAARNAAAQARKQLEAANQAKQQAEHRAAQAAKDAVAARNQATAKASAARDAAEAAEQARKTAEQAKADAHAAEKTAQAKTTQAASAQRAVRAAMDARVQAERDATRAAIRAARAVAALAPPAEPAGDRPAIPDGAVTITRHRLAVNGVDEVPAMLFGEHASNLSPEQIADWGVESFRQIYQFPAGQPVRPGDVGVPGAPDYRIPPNLNSVLETWYDRYQPAWNLREPDRWKQRFAHLAAEYGRNTRGSDRVHHVQFWNEPFVNWPKSPGVNFDGAYYDQTDTTEGTPMRILGAPEPCEYAVWHKPKVRAIRIETGDVDYLATRYGPKKIEEDGKKRDAADGDTFEWRGMQFRWELTPWGRDPTMKDTLRPGLQCALYYFEMVDEFARTMKQANPEVQLAVGWGFNIFQSGWKSWKHLYKPMIDRSWKHIDGIQEHHYGVDPRMTATSYELVTAYSATRYDKRFRFYNTEAGITAGRPPRPEEGKDFAPVAFKYGKRWLDYMLRDLSGMLHLVPDKAFTRYEHEPHNNTGSRVVFRMFKQLRGKLLATESADPRVWPVASRNGDTLCVVVFNDNYGPRDLPIAIDAPPGMHLVAGVRQTVRSDDLAHVLHTEYVEPADPRRHVETAHVEKKSAVKYLFHLAGQPADETIVTRRQFYAPEILSDITPDQPLEMTIEVDPEALKAGASAVCRLAVEHWKSEHCELVLNDRRVELPIAYNWLNDAPIDLELVKPVNTLVFRFKPEVLPTPEPPADPNAQPDKPDSDQARASKEHPGKDKKDADDKKPELKPFRVLMASLAILTEPRPADSVKLVQK